MREYSYSEAISFFEELPHFTPPKNTGVPLKDMFSLDAELALLEKLYNPHMDLKYIHVAGTNGKGSTVAYISSILDKAGLKVGTFASPFLYRYNEMFVVNGEEISDEDFAHLFSQVKPAYDELAAAGIHPSEYEILTVMGFLYFEIRKCDIVVLEVSMGGRVDTTNVIPFPVVTVITPISFDHMSILGNTLAEIATEKVGIIKPGTVVVSAAQEPEVQLVLTDFCKKNGVTLDYAKTPELVASSLNGQTFEIAGDYNAEKRKYDTTLLGTYQINNAALAIAAIEKLKERGYEISQEAISEGIRTTTWFGRFTIVDNNPIIVVDGGHNRQGAKVLRESLEKYFPDQKITFVMGILKDKEADIILDELVPISKKVYTTEVPSARTMEAKELADMIAARGGQALVLPEDVSVKSLVKTDEVICVCGSLYLLQKVKGL